jgi:hypothetical protein
MATSRWVQIAALVVLSVLAVPARGDELSFKLGKEIEKLKGLFEERHETTVAVGDFAGDPELASSGGSAIANALVDAFKAAGIAVNRRARLQVEGKYKRTSDAATGLKGLRLNMTITDKTTQDEIDLVIRIFDPATVMKIGGGTGDISGASIRERSEKADRALTEPSTSFGTRPRSAVADTRISAGAGSKYAIELLLKDSGGGYRPRAAVVKEGLAHVGLRKGDVYGVRLINETRLAAAVEVAIDGIGMFAFTDSAGDKNSRIIVQPGQSATVIGWYRNTGPKGSNEFLVGDRGEAAVLKQLPAGQARIGMVTATFSVAWPAGSPAPDGEQEVPRLGDDGPIGTKIGAETDQNMRAVDYQFGKPRASVTVRYDKTVEPVDLPR